MVAPLLVAAASYAALVTAILAVCKMSRPIITLARSPVSL
jgi:hypothetical protein